MVTAKEADALIQRLADFYEPVDPCEHGHVQHDAAAHRGRHLVHTQGRMFGADWEYDDAVTFIRSAEGISTNLFIGHVPVKAADGHVVAFEVHT